jgi:hypothetical protein
MRASDAQMVQDRGDVVAGVVLPVEFGSSGTSEGA